MPTLPTKVQPGDLVTSEFMNSLLNVCADLQTRVRNLETNPSAPGGPVIDSVDPPALRVGEQLDVRGSHFPSNPADGSSVQLGGTPITRYAFVGRSRLVFAVPPLTQALPGQVILTIRNGGQEDSEVITVLPEATGVRGTVRVASLTSTLPAATPGATLTIDFQVDSVTNIAERYRIRASFFNVTGTVTTANWLAATTLQQFRRDGSLIPVPAEPLIAPGERAEFRASIVVPNGTGGADFSLRAESVTAPSDERLNVASSPIQLTIGGTSAISDPRTKFSIDALRPEANARRAAIGGQSGIEVRNGHSEAISVTAEMSVAGAYSYSAELMPDNGDWSSSLSPLSSNEAAGGKEELVSMLDLNTRPENLATHSERRTLRIRATRNGTNDGNEIDSWTDIPIQGF